MIESVPSQDLIRIAGEANAGGTYEAARGLVNRELQRRGLAIIALHTVDMPVADFEDEVKPLVHNHSPSEGRGLDCGERTVDGYLRGWCMDDETNVERGRE